ncbi:MAG: LysR family transcriptional regulator [Firmicutes bacterium]|nr:LysR family transcriptional regulator [Bacillota bacterium]
MNISQIQYVLAVAKNSSFTKAAQELHISQPALSSNIQKLEEELGTALFNRASFPVQLTRRSADCTSSQHYRRVLLAKGSETIPSQKFHPAR